MCKAYVKSYRKYKEVRKGIRDDRRGWRDVLAEYNANAGKRVPVTLPKVEFLEGKDEEGKRNDRVAA